MLLLELLLLGQISIICTIIHFDHVSFFVVTLLILELFCFRDLGSVLRLTLDCGPVNTIAHWLT